MAIEQHYQFLQNVTPFDRLPESQLMAIAQTFDVLYYPKGEYVELSEPCLLLVIKGVIQEAQDGKVMAKYANGAYFNETSLLRSETNQASVTQYKVLEEAILYRVPQAVFLETLQSFAEFKAHFYSNIVDKLNAWHQQRQRVAATEVMMEAVCSAPIQPLVVVNADASVSEAARQMVQNKTDCCLIELGEAHESLDERWAILTSTDILRFTARQFEEDSVPSALEFRARDLANKPLQTVHELDYLFNALLKMTRFQIDRLVVRREKNNGEIAYSGFLHLKDLMGVFANQSALVLLKIEQANSVEDLAELSNQLDDLVATLHLKGIKVHYIAKLVNELHRKIIQRLISLLLPEGLHSKVAVLLLGSEGRSEQLLRTDQDNALLFVDDINADEKRQLWDFSAAFTQAMLQLGFPPCPGGVMLNQPTWRQAQTGFKAQLRDWLDKPSMETFMHLAIFADAQIVFGEEALLDVQRKFMAQRLTDTPLFLRHFAKVALQFETPVSFFGGFITRQSEKGAVIDIKKGAIFPIVHGIRVLALENGIKECNTHWRIKALMDLGVFETAQGIELGETLNYFNGLRLDAMLRQKDNAAPGQAGDSELNNDVALDDLTHLQQDILKQALQVVNQFKSFLQQHFKLRELL
ncbi:putative nucleotidyltransferase substrate binding domain-containing protein [Thiomicrorhabdus sp. 6S3-12]|uniref:putative nucleotidyltransferase substrate binding domain-containing protein n=1 Tax=Thiomicrorhabdus sp. 6S3-12 TaxID=2819681 RepID=UPI001AACD897|nr:putative nucleotidyltransferase substrate binding domain-containing protein [Thiomicrorhabdus sp. 6S3-12]MBO1924016.1 nucleotidyltransferase [Thiomicrorhabdus sp. 6S3-12]